MHKPPERRDTETKPPVRHQQRPAAHLHHHWLFVWLFVALLPTAALVVISCSELTLRRIEAALTTPHQTVEAVTSVATDGRADSAVCQVTITSPSGGQKVGPFTPVTGTVSARAAAAGDGIGACPARLSRAAPWFIGGPEGLD